LLSKSEVSHLDLSRLISKLYFVFESVYKCL
jgi:hypothetical protein